jgi:hypothetical protein
MRRVDDEQGAVAVIVAILLVVILGFGALVVDVGGLYFERRQLQNGADAGALALAADCAEGVIDCGAATIPLLASAAEPFADGNANDTRSAVPAAVAHGADPETCEPAGPSSDNPLVGVDVVKVSNETIDAANGDASFLTNVFAQVLGFDTATVTACAVAAWGYAASLSTFPLVISQCEFDLDPDEGSPTVLYPGPHPNGTAVQETILFHQGNSGDEDPCNAQAGQDTDGDDHLPAGFGWLENDGTCRIVTTVVDGDEWVNKDPGANPECGQTHLLPLVDTVVQIPVFNDFCRPPHDPAPACPNYDNKDKYRIETYASFYLQGYKLGGGPSDRGGDFSSCGASERCIVGYFTTSTALDGEMGGPPSGVTVVQLRG